MMKVITLDLFKMKVAVCAVVQWCSGAFYESKNSEIHSVQTQIKTQSNVDIERVLKFEAKNSSHNGKFVVVVATNSGGKEKIPC